MARGVAIIMNDELRVPTVALTVEVLFADGRALTGRIFVPASAPTHTGPMTVEEWLNDDTEFFAFQPEDVQIPVILNKRELIALSAQSDDETDPEEGPVPVARIVLECGGRRLEGMLTLDLPDEQRRVLDCLNQPGRFVTLGDGDRTHLVHKARITRVIEVRED